MIRISRRRLPSPLGFTLIEMLVVLTIMLILLGLIVPLAQNLLRYNGIEAGINTIGIAVIGTRAYATRNKPNLDPPIPGATYSGTAMLFTPGGEIRLVENDQTLTGTSPEDFLESRSPPLDGFSDIPERDYIRMPGDAGAVGLCRTDDTSIKLIAPPFGIRFTRYGSLISATEHANGPGLSRLVFYDSNGDNHVQTVLGNPGATRGRAFNNAASHDPYNPDDWTVGTPSFNAQRDDANPDRPGWDAAHQRWRLPFEDIETCVGVVVYSISEFRASGNNLLPEVAGDANSPINEAASNWILAQGRVVFFGRYSGAMLKESTP